LGFELIAYIYWKASNLNVTQEAQPYVRTRVVNLVAPSVNGEARESDTRLDRRHNAGNTFRQSLAAPQADLHASFGSGIRFSLIKYLEVPVS
jgi:hypothetical protein